MVGHQMVQGQTTGNCRLCQQVRQLISSCEVYTDIEFGLKYHAFIVKNLARKQTTHLLFIPGSESTETSLSNTAEITNDRISDGIPHTSSKHYDENIRGVQLLGGKTKKVV